MSLPGRSAYNIVGIALILLRVLRLEDTFDTFSHT
jgi:hypothetical protein